MRFMVPIPARAAAGLALVLALGAGAPARALAVPHDAGAAGSAAPADTARLRRWRADIAFVADRVRNVHPRPFVKCPAAVFDSARAAIEAHLGEWDDARTGVELMRWVALLGDGHTMALATLPPLGFTSVLPLAMRPFEDGLYVIAAAPPYASAVGAKVVRIGDRDAAEALGRALTVCSGDHRYTKLDRVPLFMMMPGVWKALGVTPGDRSVSLELERGGTRTRLEVAGGPPPAGFPQVFLESEPRWPAGWVSARTFPGGAEPRCDRRPGESWWFEVLPDSQVVYARMRQMDRVSGGRIVTEFYRELFAAVDRVRPRALVVDLRQNHGGNNGIVDELVRRIVQRPWLDRPGGVYALIDRGTFSAAMNAAVFLEAQTQATFVGEPTGGGRNHYGDAPQVTTPNLGIMLQVSTIPWLSRYPGDDRPWIAPEIATPATFAAWRGGGDDALAAVLDAVRDGTAPVRVLAAAKREGPEAGVAAWRAAQAARPNPWADTAGDPLFDFAADLAESGRTADAALFGEVMVRAEPQSGGAWRVAGSAHAAAGERDRAIECFRKALALNPRAEIARAMLARLEGKP